MCTRLKRASAKRPYAASSQTGVPASSRPPRAARRRLSSRQVRDVHRRTVVKVLGKARDKRTTGLGLIGEHHKLDRNGARAVRLEEGRDGGVRAAQLHAGHHHEAVGPRERLGRIGRLNDGADQAPCGLVDTARIARLGVGVVGHPHVHRERRGALAGNAAGSSGAARSVASNTTARCSARSRMAVRPSSLSLRRMAAGTVAAQLFWVFFWLTRSCWFI